MEKIGPHFTGGGGLVKRSIICLSEIIFIPTPTLLENVKQPRRLSVRTFPYRTASNVLLFFKCIIGQIYFKI